MLVNDFRQFRLSTPRNHAQDCFISCYGLSISFHQFRELSIPCLLYFCWFLVNFQLIFTTRSYVVLSQVRKSVFNAGNHALPPTHSMCIGSKLGVCYSCMQWLSFVVEYIIFVLPSLFCT